MIQNIRETIVIAPRDFCSPPLCSVFCHIRRQSCGGNSTPQIRNPSYAETDLLRFPVSQRDRSAVLIRALKQTPNCCIQNWHIPAAPDRCNGVGIESLRLARALTESQPRRPSSSACAARLASRSACAAASRTASGKRRISASLMARSTATMSRALAADCSKCASFASMYCLAQRMMSQCQHRE